MKLIFKKVGENTSYYRKANKGFEFIGTAENEADFQSQIITKEDYFPQENGFVLNDAGNEVFDPNYPDRFEDCDYSYYLEDAEKLDWEFDCDYWKIEAIKAENPYNLSDILELIGDNQ